MSFLAVKPQDRPFRVKPIKKPQPFWDMVGRTGRRLAGLGAAYPKPPYGSRNWWYWYATYYLPQYYNQQQVYRLLLQSPFYNQFGLPPQFSQYQQPQYPYGTANYSYYGYNYPYYQNPAPYYAPGYQPPYDYSGSPGIATCQQYGGFWDAINNACNYGAPYGNTYAGFASSPPNVIGLPEGQAIQSLNAAGFNVWELSRDGISQGNPADYNPRRVQISVVNGTITGSVVG